MAKDPRDSRKWRALSKSILARDGYTCVYCGQPATGTDHIVSVSSQPELALNRDNLVACCRLCNSRKGNRSQQAFLAMTLTPPVFSTSLSPRTVTKALQGPCMGQESQDLT